MTNAVSKLVIGGCGDIGRRIIKEYFSSVDARDVEILALSQSKESAALNKALGVTTALLDLDAATKSSGPDAADQNSIWQGLDGGDLVYLIPPQREGVRDRRCQGFLELLQVFQAKPAKVVVISTTGVYGDAEGAWVDEQTPLSPQTERGQRRLDMEQQWQAWSAQNGASFVILRVPGIYAYDRIPRRRLQQGTPVVRAQECGFTNRIHADDLARACIAALNYRGSAKVFNVSDGRPGTISEYLQAAAEVAGLPALPEITMAEAQQQLSSGMLSYLSESRRISNQRMLQELKVALRYPDFREGLRH